MGRMSRTRDLLGAWRAARRLAANPIVMPGAAAGDELPPLPRDVALRADALLAIPASGQVVFRLLGRSTPRAFDFQSARDRDRPIRPGQEFIDHLGLSVFGSEDAAIAIAQRFPKLVARVYLPAGEGFTLARTLEEIDAHYTLWGDPETLLRGVVHVKRLDADG
jgi:hypothetical protein